MIEKVQAWLGGRTARERLIVRVGSVVLVGLVLPVWALTASIRYRADAATVLAGARETAGLVAKLAEAPPAAASLEQASEGALRARALAEAAALGLIVETVQAEGPERLRIAFAPGDSRAVYRWIDSMARGGAFISQTAIVREGDSEAVRAEVALAASPS